MRYKALKKTYAHRELSGQRRRYFTPLLAIVEIINNFLAIRKVRILTVLTFHFLTEVS